MIVLNDITVMIPCAVALSIDAASISLNRQTVNETKREVIGVYYSNYPDTDILSCSLNNSTQTGPSCLCVLATHADTHTILRVVRLGPRDKVVLCAAVLTKESELTLGLWAPLHVPSYTQIC